MSEQEPRYVFALVSQGRAELTSKLEELLDWVSRAAKVRFSHEISSSYEALAEKMEAREVDVAWLPPLVFVRLEGRGIVAPLVTNLRAGRATYQSVLVVRADSPIRALADLRGARAAWVDPLSAAGYLLPQGQIAAQCGDPRTLFTEQRFLGSHAAALDAVRKSEADVAGTYGAAGSDGELVQDASEHGLRVLATFGSVPADVIGARASMPEEIRTRIGKAFVAAGEDEKTKGLARAIFGIEGFRLGAEASYAGLHPSLRAALASGLLRAVDAQTEKA
jgi:phosphate/phosphite/phosphonate ABC transporter binding protein